MKSLSSILSLDRKFWQKKVLTRVEILLMLLLCSLFAQGNQTVINGDLNISGNYTISINDTDTTIVYGNVSVTTGTITINGTLIIEGGNIILNASSGDITLEINGTVIVSDRRKDGDDFIIIENSSADPILQLPNEDYNIIKEDLKNIKGKHDGELLSKCILKQYYNINKNLIFDFDDTIWSRKWKEDIKLHKISRENVLLLNDLISNYDITIVSGNSYQLKKS